MSSNPYEAPQTTPSRDPLRMYRWVGAICFVLSAFFAIMPPLMILKYSSSREYLGGLELGIMTVIHLVIATGLFYAGRYFRRKGRRPLE